MLLRWIEQRNGIEASIDEEEVGLVLFSHNKTKTIIQPDRLVRTIFLCSLTETSFGQKRLNLCITKWLNIIQFFEKVRIMIQVFKVNI